MFEGRDCLVICDVEYWYVALLLHVYGHCVKGFVDGGVGEVLDWHYVDIVCVAIVRHIVVLVSVDGSDRERASCACVGGSCILSASAAQQNNAVHLFLLWDDMSLCQACVVYRCCVFIVNYRLLLNCITLLLAPAVSSYVPLALQVMARGISSHS